jgi:hypothetical protein
LVIGVVILYGVNSAQNAMMACTNPPARPRDRRNEADKENSRRVEERPPKQGQVWRCSLRCYGRVVHLEPVESKFVIWSAQERIPATRVKWNCIIDSHSGLNRPIAKDLSVFSLLRFSMDTHPLDRARGWISTHDIYCRLCETLIRSTVRKVSLKSPMSKINLT